MTADAGHRRRFQFSLGAMLFAVALAAGWLGLYVQGSAERETRLAIADAGGYSFYDWGLGRPPPLPPWLASLVGGQRFIHIEHVELPDWRGRKLLRRIARLPALKHLILVGPHYDDTDLEHVAALERLEVLSLAQTRISDAGVKQLATIGTLRLLNLRDTKVGDAGLAELARLDRLEVLVLSGASVSDAGLRQLGNFPLLEQLYLSNTSVTDAAVDDLTGLARLKILALAGSQVTSQGASTLAKRLPNCWVSR